MIERGMQVQTDTPLYYFIFHYVLFVGILLKLRITVVNFFFFLFQCGFGTAASSLFVVGMLCSFFGLDWNGYSLW